MHLALIGGQQACHNLWQRRFACAVRPNERADAAAQIDGNVCDGGEFAKALGNLAAIDLVRPPVGLSRCKSGQAPAERVLR
jgi:hypothetical protein